MLIQLQVSEQKSSKDLFVSFQTLVQGNEKRLLKISFVSKVKKYKLMSMPESNDLISADTVARAQMVRGKVLMRVDMFDIIRPYICKLNCFQTLCLL